MAAFLVGEDEMREIKFRAWVKTYWFDAGDKLSEATLEDALVEIGKMKRDQGEVMEDDGGDDLSQCPFCGGGDLAYESYLADGWIECNDCGAKGPTTDQAKADPPRAERQAKAKWNRNEN